MRAVVLYPVFTFILAASAGQSAESLWPIMKEFADSFAVDTKAAKIEFIKPLYDLNGVARYVFVCRGGDDWYLDELERQTRILYVGPLGCRLSEANKEVEYSLLADDELAPWHTRGQYHSYNEVVGDCGRYPEYGSVRHFRLRGFELTLSAVDQIFDSLNQLVSFRMKVSLRQDDTIKSRQAEQTGYLPPHEDCKTIMKGNEPRMCRNRVTGSWEQCKK